VVGLLQLGVSSPTTVNAWAVTLQRVQNAAALLVWQRDYISPIMIQLHWLPIRSRVQLKLSTVMHTIHNRRSPSYLWDAVQTVATATTCCSLWSSTTTDSVLPSLVSRSLHMQAPLPSRGHSSTVPVHIWTCNLYKTFKTFLFVDDFNTT